MNKWLLLLLSMFCWFGAGFVVFSGTWQSDDVRAVTELPTRIVSMAPSLTEILFALGLDDQIVGVTIFSDYPAAAKQKMKVGSFYQPNIEAVIAANSDLVITLDTSLQKSFTHRLERINCNNMTVHIETVNELFEAIKEIGRSTGKQPQATELVASLNIKLDNLRASIATEKKVRVLWVVQRNPLRVAGRDTFVNEMIELAGGENAIGATVHKYPPIGAEQIYSGGIDVIIEPAMAQKNLQAQLAAARKYWSKFKNVPAVKNDRIYVVDGDTVSRLGPRLYEGVETIARCLKPELFENK